MGWKRPELEAMVCDCCGLSVMPEFGDSPDGTETVPEPHEWGFVWMEFAEGVGQWGCFPKSRGDLWCDGCVSAWEEHLQLLPESQLEKLEESRVEAEGQPMMDALYPSWKASRVAMVKVAATE